MQFMIRPVLLYFLLIALLASPAGALSSAEQIKSLDDAALAAYSAGKQQMLAHHGPVIIVLGSITLLMDGTEKHESITPAIYTNLKTVSHVALGTIGLLEAYASDPAATVGEWRSPLEKLRAETEATLPILGTLDFDADALARSRAITERMLALSGAALTNSTFTRDDVVRAAREIAPLLLANATEAAHAQIDLLHAIVQKWRAEMSPEQWATVRVFVLGPRQPREDNLQFSYFRFAMGDDAVNKRLIYAENVFTKDGAMKLLATVLSDRTLAENTFGDEMRMDRDLLGDAAQEYLLQVFGKLGRTAP